MGKVCFSEILRYTCLAAITVAAAFIAAITFANPASAAGETGRGNDGTLKEWDTDNLSRWVSSSFGRAGARNYRIPYHNYSDRNYRTSAEAKACVGYNVHYGGSLRRSLLLPQNATTGECPSGYSLVTQVCVYSGYTPYGGYNSAGGRYVPLVSQPASYRVPNSTGTCDRIRIDLR